MEMLINWLAGVGVNRMHICVGGTGKENLELGPHREARCVCVCVCGVHIHTCALGLEEQFVQVVPTASSNVILTIRD